jgi:hypothetical protein
MTPKKVLKPKKDEAKIITSDQVLAFLREQSKPVPQSAVDLYFGNKRPELWGTLDKLVRAGNVTKSKRQPNGDPDERKVTLYKAK